jgi:hypothetical protein
MQTVFAKKKQHDAVFFVKTARFGARGSLTSSSGVIQARSASKGKRTTARPTSLIGMARCDLR